MKEKVVIIYSTYNFTNRDGINNKINAKRPPLAVEDRFYPPLGLLYLAAVLERENIDVEFVDVTFLKNCFQAVRDLVVRQKPLVVGIYVSTFNLPLVKNMIPQIRNLSSETSVVIGGPHVHFEPAAVGYLGADFGVVSDGEFAFLELVKAIFNNNDTAHIPNIIRKTGDGRIAVSPLQPIENLDTLPFPARRYWPYRIFSPLFNGNTASMLSSRGCVFNCAFCASPHRGAFRPRSVKNIIEELKYLSGSGVNSVDFVDDTMTLDRNRMENLCNEIIRQRLRIKWGCMSRIDTVDKDLLVLMKRANCTHIKYGIESGSERVRSKLMNKQITNLQVKKILKETREAGLFSVGYFVLGMPGESVEEARETLRFALGIGVDYVDFRMAMLFPGSAMSAEALQANKIPVDIWQRFANGENLIYSVLDEETLSQMKFLRAQAMREHYFNISFLIKEITDRTTGISSLCNKIKILLDKRYNSYLSYKSFSNFNPRASLFLNYCRMLTDRLMCYVLRLAGK